MNKFVIILELFILFCLVNFPFPCNSTPTDQEIAKAYASSDYGAAVRLLEQQIGEQREKLSKGEKLEFQKLYKQYLLLAHIYAWRWNRPEVALLKYQELNEWKKLCPPPSKLFTLELLYIAEIHEMRKDWAKAREYYESLLSELADFAEKENDDVVVLMSEDLKKFVKYQIDGLRLKTGTEKGSKPLLTRLKLSSQLAHHVTPLLVLVLVPGAEHLFLEEKPGDLVRRIQQSPSDLSSMILNYALIIATSAAHVDESSEKAMEAYLAKYPESYYSLQLRYLFHKFYRESGQNKKAEKLAKEVDKIARKRGIEVIIGPDKRFSSPERTWETFRNALIEGNIDVVAECYIPGRRGHGKAFKALGREEMKEIGRSMGNIHKVKVSETTAEYMLITKKNGKEFSYAIRFQNLDGEWKMYEF